MRRYISFGRSRRKSAESIEFGKLKNIIVTNDNRTDGLFSADWYYEAYPDVKAEGQDALWHYLNHGHMEGRNPGPNFDNDFYRAHNPDVVAAGINPLVHYLQSGRAEGRAPNARMLSSTKGGEARHVIVKEIEYNDLGEVAILVTHAPSGRLKPHVLPYVRMLSANDVAVLLLVVVDRPLELLPEEIAAAAGIIVRENKGYDFGAWAHALRIEPKLYSAKILYLTNDSVIPRTNGHFFREMLERVRLSDADVVGLTSSHEYRWHISSYFLAIKPKALGSWVFHHFINDIEYLNDKDQVIQKYEVPFAARMRGGRLGVEALYNVPYAGNPTLFGWRELVADGFPFVKLLLLRRQFLEAGNWPKPIKEAIDDIQENWPEVLEEAGFDVNLIKASILAAEIADLPRNGDFQLLVDQQRFDGISRDRKLRVAFFGPWNYDNGLGAASRDLLCALRHTDIRLNTYPITKPFHVHRLICPAVATKDFAGRADIAVVHLNPDSWHLLTDEQRQIIQSAKQRIGYWVWETDTLPPAWNHNIRSVDRVWAPSTYCADVFSAAMDVPVDVIPHPVRVPAVIATRRDVILKRLGVDPSQKVILYIFDGASYLVRKNPEALIRAFGNTDLAGDGWTLLLKVKHLFDRPEAGKSLAALASATPGVILADVSLHSDEVISLLAAADIYASPHCSEGFGLTVAESMAAGKIVVATDFGGTRDFLTKEVGFPVPATPSTLDQDHGHYLQGHSWATIDESALGSALVEAAKRVVDGDKSLGTAARGVIEDQLSYRSVANSIEHSFLATIEKSQGENGRKQQERITRPIVRPPEAPDFKIDPEAGINFGTARFSEGVIPIVLTDELALGDEHIPDGKDTDWLFFAPGNVRVMADADRVLLNAASQRPDVELFYGDDVACKGKKLDRVRLKPDFNWTLLVAQDYIGAPIMIRRKALKAIGGVTPGRKSGMLYDLVLKVADAGRTISRLPEVLIVYPGHRPIVDLDVRRAILQSSKEMENVDLVEGAAPGLLVQRRRFDHGTHPAVTVMIPTNRTRRPGSNETYLERLLGRLAETAWPLEKITVIVGDNFTDIPEWSRRQWGFNLRRVVTPEHQGDGFNYAAKANALLVEARDEYVVFMNDDAAPSNPWWLGAMIGFLVDQSVGCVGAQLFYENGAIQHAGMFPSLRTVVHAWIDWPADAKVYMDWSHAQREWSMVTGAVFATRRSVMDRVGGFDEQFSLEFNDVDLCLRIRNLGYRVIYNPDARFTHAEKASRGETAPPGAEVALFLSRWSDWLGKDPASHPSYAKDRFDIVPTIQNDSWFIEK